MKEVAGDVTHSLLHLDSRVWRTVRLLVGRPGELTREFIAGRHQHCIPPFRLYLAISILFFALTALLPGPIRQPEGFEREIAGELGKEGIDVARLERSATGAQSCTISLSDDPRFDALEQALDRACRQIRQDGGARLAEHFAATAPKLMFLFLPLMAAVMLLFYWRPRRLYAEHLVLFLHNHAFVFLLIGVSQVLGAISALPVAFSDALDFVNFLLYVVLFWYVYESMRVVYGESRFKTLFKYFAIGTVYALLLGVTVMAGLAYTIVGLP
jgi:hypothetical protein